MKRALILLAVLAMAVPALCGCGTTQATDQDYVKQAEVKAAKIREIFDKVKGDWNALTPEDKSAFIALYKDEAEAKVAWEGMLNPRPRGGMPMGG